MKIRPAGAGLLSLILLLLVALLAARANGVDYAMQLTGAQHSMLLDVDKAGENLVAVGERGHILVSTDQGDSWKQVQVPASVMLTRLTFIDELNGWAVGHDGNVLHSRDGGFTWALQRDGLADQVRINEQRAGRARQRVADLEQALSTAPEEDWSHKLDNPEELHLNGVAGDGRGGMYLASEWGTVFRSGNGGETWEALETGYDGSYFGVIINPESGDIFAYGLRGTIYRAADDHEWQPLDSGVVASLFGATAEGATLVFVGRGGTATLTADNGASFHQCMAGQGQPHRLGRNAG